MTTNGIHFNLPLELSNPPGPPHRRAKHCRASTLNSHSAMFSQLPCFGVYTNSSLSSNARALAGSKVLYSDAPVCVLRLSISSVIRCACG